MSAKRKKPKQPPRKKKQWSPVDTPILLSDSEEDGDYQGPAPGESRRYPAVNKTKPLPLSHAESSRVKVAVLEKELELGKEIAASQKEIELLKQKLEADKELLEQKMEAELAKQDARHLRASKQENADIAKQHKDEVVSKLEKSSDNSRDDFRFLISHITGSFSRPRKGDGIVSDDS